MLEQHRIEYLQAMGIQLWMPREVLPNAPEPRWLAESPGQGNSAGAPDAVKGGHAAELLAGMGFGSAETAAPKTSAAPAAGETATQSSAQVSVQSPAQQEAQPQQIEQAAQTAAQSLAAKTESPLKPATPEAAEQPADAPVDMTVPHFELHFVLWPCGTLWVGSQQSDQALLVYQASVSSFITGSNYRQHSLFSFKWPYLEISSEDQSKPVALRALHAQWDHIKSQGSKQWVAMDEASSQWFEQVAGKPLLAVASADQLFVAEHKKALWLALVK